MKKLFTIIAMLLAMSVNAQWQPDVRLTNVSGESYSTFINERCVASNGNLVHVVWHDYRDGSDGEIYYKRSTDGGVTWGADTRLTNSSARARYPSIAVSGSNVHIVWSDNRDFNYEIYYKRSTDNGISWDTDARLTNKTAYSEFPTIAVSGSNVQIVWCDARDSNYEIYYKRSTDGGITWGSDTRLTNNIYSSEYPSIAIFGSNVHIVWNENRDGNDEIYYKRSTDDGINWGSDLRLTNNTATSWAPSIAVSGSNVHIAWYDNRDGNDEIYYKRSTDSGINWGTDSRLTNNSAYSWVPSIAVSGSKIHIVWIDARDGNYEIYYKRSTNSGIIWEADTRLTNDTANSHGPSIDVSGSNVHVIWNDDRDGNREIYYKRNPTGNIIGIQNISTEIPSSYSLGQNYPNPFNPVTVIRCQLPVAGDVSLKVYDVRGREVQMLVNERLNAGTYEVKFDGSMLTSGVYFYKIVTEGFAETKRMVLIK